MYLKRGLFLNKLRRWRPATSLKMNPTPLFLKVFSTESELVFEILKVSGGGTYYSEIFGMVDSGSSD